MILPRPRPSVILKDVSEGAILFCTETETYFSLNQVGVEIWHLLPPACRSEADLVSALARKHPEVSQETISADVRSLLQELLQHRLVENLQPA